MSVAYFDQTSPTMCESLSPNAGAVLWMELVSRVPQHSGLSWKVSDVLETHRREMLRRIVPGTIRLADVGHVKAQMIFQRNNCPRPLSEPLVRRPSSLRYEMSPEDVEEESDSLGSASSRSSVQSTPSPSLDAALEPEVEADTVAEEIAFYTDPEPVVPEEMGSPALMHYLGLQDEAVSDGQQESGNSRASQLLEMLLECHTPYQRLPSEKVTTRDISWPLETMYTSLADRDTKFSTDRISKSAAGACKRAKAHKVSLKGDTKLTGKGFTLKKLRANFAELRRYIPRQSSCH